jgi:transcriptional regulator with XRE-family HTH domain
MGLTQSDVADHLGISFQQIQKYELGRNRISASRLHLAAQLLKVEVGYFFEGLAQPEADTLTAQDAQEAEVLKLLRGRTPETRDAIVRILRAAAA